MLLYFIRVIAYTRINLTAVISVNVLYARLRHKLQRMPSRVARAVCHKLPRMPSWVARAVCHKLPRMPSWVARAVCDKLPRMPSWVARAVCHKLPRMPSWVARAVCNKPPRMPSWVARAVCHKPPRMPSWVAHEVPSLTRPTVSIQSCFCSIPCRATWNLDTNSAFALGPRKTTENLHRVGRSQALPNATDF
jgi:hypothetical protein